MQRLLSFIKLAFLGWLLSTSSTTIGEFHASTNAASVSIPGLDGSLKFTEEGKTDLLVEAPAGYVPISASRKTVPYEPYKLILENGLTLTGADHHIVMNDIGTERRLIDLAPGELIQTKQGLSAVVSVMQAGKEEQMYDLEVDHPSHTYYTNDIVSHNTTVIAAYLLWFACFRSEKYVLVASKDNDAAIDVMDRIRYGYEELPMWLKPGCIYNNRHEIVFDNDSAIKSSATTEGTGRGRAVSLLMLDELAFVKPDIQTGMWTSLAPTLSTGGQCIISSTPNGDQELFAQLWRDANTYNGEKPGRNGFFPVRVAWDEHPDRDESYRQAMIGKVGELAWKQEYESTIYNTIITIKQNGQERNILIGELYELLSA